MLFGLAGASMAVWAAAEATELGSGSLRFLYRRDSGAESCPAPAELQAAVRARLGYDPFAAGAAVTLMTRVEGLSGNWRGEIELIDAEGVPRGARQVTSDAETCDELARALVLTISIAIDPESAENPAPIATPGPAAEPLPEPPTAVSPPPPPLRTGPAFADEGPASEIPGPEPEPPARVESLSLKGMSMLGVAPGVAFGGAATLMINDAKSSAGKVLVSVGLRWLKGPDGDVDASARVHVSLLAGEGGVCAHAGVVEYCAVGVLGSASVGGAKVTHPHTNSAFFAALGVQLGLVAPFSPWLSGQIHLEGLGVPAPIRAQIDAQTVWSAPPATAALSLGLRAHF